METTTVHACATYVHPSKRNGSKSRSSRQATFREPAEFTTAPQYTQPYARLPEHLHSEARKQNLNQQKPGTQTCCPRDGWLGRRACRTAGIRASAGRTSCALDLKQFWLKPHKLKGTLLAVTYCNE